MNEVLRDPRGRWLPGTASPSPGRPLSSRHKIAEAMLADLAESWKLHGRAALDRVAKDDPSKFLTIAYGILPRDVLLTVEHEPGPLDGMSPEEMRGLLETVRQLRAKTIEVEIEAPK